MTEAQEIKQKAIDRLNDLLKDDALWAKLIDIDDRLGTYFMHLSSHVSVDPEDADDLHNVYEVLGGIKFLRLLQTYPFNKKKVQKVIKLREGEWSHDGRTWKHIKGGLTCPGTSGDKVYRWQPFQVFVLASTFGFYSWINTELHAGTKAELLPTERERDGYIWDYRRLCKDFVYFGPRKTDKTGLAAYIQFIFFFFEDNNAEIYCAANAASQSALLFSRTRQLVAQMQSDEMIRSTQTVIDWRDQYKSVRNSSIRPLSAGGKTKDGMFAQLCCADEFGSASYTNGKSDMLALVNVIQSSMGPRREPMTFTTTTAGTIQSGPFIEKLDALHKLLLTEIDPNAEHTIADDSRLCLCLEPDEWETEEEVILTKRSLRYKVNPMLGLIVQHASYDSWISEARGDHTKMGELIAKYFNHYQTGKVKNWIVTADKVRQLQHHLRVSDCRYAEGWDTFVGMDFSSGEDIFAITYFSVCYPDRNPTLRYEQRFVIDCDAWILEAELNRSPNRPMYELWIKQGWLHVVPGEVFDADYAINALMALDAQGINLRMFGYDPAQSRQPINTLKAWLQSIFIQRRSASMQQISQLISSMVVPVSQNFMTMNGLVGEIEHYILSKIVRFSMNPIWPWMFGNVSVVYSRDDTLRRLHKSAPQNKIDCIHALLDALHVFDISEAKIQTEI